MNKKLTDYAIKHHLSLGHNEQGYYIRNPKTLQIVALSHKNTIHSGMIMLKKFVKVLETAPQHAYWK
jgi:hypothetical protein